MRLIIKIACIVISFSLLSNVNFGICEGVFKDYSYLMPDYLRGYSNYINLEAVDDYNNIWININNELWKLNPERTSLEKVELPQSFYLVRFKAGKDSNYYLLLDYGKLIEGENPVFANYDGNSYFNLTDVYIDSLTDSLTTDYQYSNVPSDFYILKNNTFIFSNYRYLLKYDGINYEFIRIPSEFGDISRDNMTIDKNDNIVTAISDKGIVSFNGSEWKTNYVEGVLPFGSNHIYVDKKNNIWVYGRGAAKYNGSSWELFMNKFTDDDYETIPFYHRMAEDNQGRYWFVHNFGIIIYDGEYFESLTTIPTDTDPYLYLHGIETTIADKNGDIWFCYYYGGNDYKLICHENNLAVNDAKEIPAGFDLKNYPNPFNPSTTISFNLSSECFCDLSIYNITGQKICTLISGKQNAGSKEIYWNGKDYNDKEVSTGIYFLKLKSAGHSATTKILKMK